MPLRRFLAAFIVWVIGFLVASANPIQLQPAPGAVEVPPDTPLFLTFSAPPEVSLAGLIKVYEGESYTLVDEIDLGLPAGPTEPNRTRVPYSPTPYDYSGPRKTNLDTEPGTPSGAAAPTSRAYQLSIIGGFTDGFHFHPLIVRERTARITLHHNVLKPAHTYFVELPAGLFRVDDWSFPGCKGPSLWRFKTRPAPAADKDPLIVSADGTGDFATVQGALDFIPDHNEAPRRIFIRNGRYEEIVYFRNKRGLTIEGESRDGVVICYANNEVFNPRPSNIATNEVKGTFPSRRAVFMADNCTDLVLRNFTVHSLNERPAQAEGLLLMGERNAVHQVTIRGSGDALQVNGSAYFEDCLIHGIGDNVLGRGPAYFRACTLITTGGPHVWVRNTKENHGNVFVECTFRSEGAPAVLARSPNNHGKSYPDAEMVLLRCRLAGVTPEGWGPIASDSPGLRFWEFASVDADSGQPVDVTQRHPLSRQLQLPADAELIRAYEDPAWVLGGWRPTRAINAIPH